MTTFILYWPNNKLVSTKNIACVPSEPFAKDQFLDKYILEWSLISDILLASKVIHNTLTLLSYI